MDEVRAIQEALHYIGKYRGSIIVIKLNKTIIERRETLLKIIKDLNLLKMSGIKIFVVNTWPELIKDALFGDLPMLPFEKNKGLSKDETVAKLTINLKADKLIFITQNDGIFVGGELIRQATIRQAKKLLEIPNIVTGEIRDKLKAAIMACKGGVDRVHIISGFRDGALLKEILSCKGLGTMIHKSSSYQRIREAEEKDILGIVKILDKQSFALPGALTDTSKNLKNILVFVVDEEIHGSVIITEHKAMHAIEASYLAVSSTYEESDALQKLLVRVIKNAQQRNFQYVVLDKNKNHPLLGIYPWFLKLGFKKLHLKEFPRFSDKIQITKAWIKSLE